MMFAWRVRSFEPDNGPRCLACCCCYCFWQGQWQNLEPGVIQYPVCWYLKQRMSADVLGACSITHSHRASLSNTIARWQDLISSTRVTLASRGAALIWNLLMKHSVHQRDAIVVSPGGGERNKKCLHFRIFTFSLAFSQKLQKSLKVRAKRGRCTETPTSSVKSPSKEK